MTLYVNDIPVFGNTQIQYVIVADINDPSVELSTRSNGTGGKLLIAQQIMENDRDRYSIYFWNVDDYEDIPEVVVGDGGYWVRLDNNAKRMALIFG